MKENKQIIENQESDTNVNLRPDSIDILDLLETASSWLVSPEDEKCTRKKGDFRLANIR